MFLFYPYPSNPPLVHRHFEAFFAITLADLLMIFLISSLINLQYLMYKILVIACALCLLFTSALAQNNIEPQGSEGAVKIETQTYATNSLPKEKQFLSDLLTFIKQKVQVGTNVIKALGNIKNIASTASASAQANPVVSSAVAGAASVGIAAAHIASTGATYRYNATDSGFREKIQIAKKITQIEKYSSPLLPIKDAFLQHHEVTLQLDGMIWVLFSFEKEGLLTKIAFTSKELVGPDRTLIEGRKVNVSAKKLLDFLKRYDGQEYHLLLSNCRDFSSALWDTIVQ